MAHLRSRCLPRPGILESFPWFAPLPLTSLQLRENPAEMLRMGRSPRRSQVMSFPRSSVVSAILDAGSLEFPFPPFVIVFDHPTVPPSQSLKATGVANRA